MKLSSEDKDILAWAEKNKIGVPTTYSNPEMAQMLALLKAVPDGGVICEIGVLYGRTASLYFLENKRRTPKNRYTIHLIDSWVLNEGDARPSFDRMVCLLDRPLYFDHWKPSQRAVNEVSNNLDLLHIDADHDRGVWDDCRNYLPKVKIGGVVVFHDYGLVLTYPE